ncbi:MAG: hypothetical protein ABFE07_29285 [Armatimonadia bacterium]
MKKRIEAILAAPSIRGAAEDILALLTERLREERLCRAHFECTICQCTTPVVLDLGASNWTMIDAACPQCGAKHSVEFVRTVEPKRIRPQIKPGPSNGRLF